MKKVSFDYDGTLSRIDIQNYASRLLDLGYEVYVTTARDSSCKWKSTMSSFIDDWNRDLFRVTDLLGIKRENINFCNNQNKSDFLDSDIIFHLDDDEIELMNLKDSGRYIGIDATNPKWESMCNLRLNIK